MGYKEENKLAVALIQADIEIGSPIANKKHLEELMEKAVLRDSKPDLLVLPEMWNTGYALEQIQDIADPEGRDSKAWLSAFAQKHGVMIVGGSVAVQQNGQIYNTMYAFDQNGQQIGEYSKLHLFRLMDEEKHLTAGTELVSFDLGGFQAGASICYDIRFPELARSLALGGAKMLIVPAEWPHPRLHHWRTLLMARAIENQMYVIACNRVGSSRGTDFFGHSLIIDPWGEIIAEGSESEEIVTGLISPGLVDEVRGRIPVFADRRPELYRDK
ncbi:carbon-nitrogen family hydrolase [Paenibacillus sp. HJL G12]|uniref:Carbon-nitrogen family hydrolase n=1 Tax=Paenibacillus dendrobii TaxID=2691084 RepID=A0A7X3IEW7_9BACL|nr:carbon-nitrogen family hydrolase [Paenibacillus dendrobii]MWV42031.1 carbon-nitrogen family hydrolase [Paenibacillus dendrobii]